MYYRYCGQLRLRISYEPATGQFDVTVEKLGATKTDSLRWHRVDFVPASISRAVANECDTIATCALMDLMYIADGRRERVLGDFDSITEEDADRLIGLADADGSFIVHRRKPKTP